MPVEATKFQNFEAIAGGVVNHDDMVIKGVSVMTQGVAKGHNVLIDKTTLEQLRDVANEFEGGVRVKMDHFSEFGASIGMLRNFRVKGKKLLADLHLLKNHDKALMVLEMAENMPDTFGLSASFSGKDEEIDGLAFARVDELYTVDLVDQPAANPSGLFEAKSDNAPKGKSSPQNENQSQTTMSTNADNSNALAETVKQQGEVLNQLSSGLADVTKALGAISKKMDGDEGLSDETKLSDLSVGELRGVIKGETAEQMKALGWKPGDNRNLEQGGDQGTRQSPSDGQQQQQASADQGGDDGEPKNFQAVIVKLVQDGMKESDAVAFAIKNPKYHSLYEAWKKDGGTAHFMAA